MLAEPVQKEVPVDGAQLGGVTAIQAGDDETLSEARAATRVRRPLIEELLR